MNEDPERLLVVTSTPEGVAPLSPGERSMMREEPGQVEQTAIVGETFPSLRREDIARASFEEAKAALAASDARRTLAAARNTIQIQPSYLPAHLYEELAMNLIRGRDLRACAEKGRAIIDLATRMLAGAEPLPPCERPVEPVHIMAQLDMAHYNLSDRLMRLGLYGEALDMLSRSASLPKGTEALMKRRLKEASLLFRLKDFAGSKTKLKEAWAMDRELFFLLRERMSYDGHAGLEQPI